MITTIITSSISYITVLSSMSAVKLISATPKAEELISYCARVSNPSNQDNPESERLIRYLINHKHWSPFEMAHVVMEINTTRAVAAQILRHRSFSFQEFSQRYADVSSLEFATPPSLRRQDTKNRQNSIDDLDPKKVQLFQSAIAAHYADAEDLYREMIESGVAKECAREVLPLGTPSRLYMSGTVRSWIHYIDLRRANGTQLEHQQIAVAAERVLRGVVPTVCSVLWD